VAGEVTGLVVAKLDRISRSVVDFGNLLAFFEDAEATLVALDLGVDTSTPGGRLVANVLASVAEWERSAIAERTRDALAVRKANGLTVSRPASPRRSWPCRGRDAPSHGIREDYARSPRTSRHVARHDRAPVAARGRSDR